MQHAAEPVVTGYRAQRGDGLPAGERRAAPEPPGRPGHIVVTHVLTQNPLEVLWPQGQ
jgi:hypothetical protein